MGFFRDRRPVQQRGSHLALSLILLAACLHPASAQPKFRLTLSNADAEGLRPSCESNLGWSYGRLLGYDSNHTVQPVLCVHDWSGKGERIPFGIPGATRISLRWAAMAPDGGIALVGSASMDDGTAGTFVARVSSDRTQQVVTRVWPYCAIKVVVASDGVLWTFGWVLNEEHDPVEQNVLRRFDQAGRVISTASIRVSRSPMMGDAVEISTLAASNDRVAWLTNANEYIEFALDGREVLRKDGPAASSSKRVWQYLALSPEGLAMVATETESGHNIAILDRRTGVWIRMATAAPKPGLGRVMGFEGEDVVLDLGRGFHRHKVEVQ